MGDIIRTWLQERLGVAIDTDMSLFAETAQDGTLLAELLHSYEIMPQEDYLKIQKSLKATDHNLSIIQRCLTANGIRLDHNEFMKMAAKEPSAAVNIFYEVYLHLENKSSLHFITDKKISKKNMKLMSNQRVSSSISGEMLQTRMQMTSRDLSLPLAQAHDVVHWYKDRMDMLRSKCQEARDEYLDIVRTKLNECTKSNEVWSSYKLEADASSVSLLISILHDQNLDDTKSDGSFSKVTYNELKSLENKAKNMPEFVPDQKICTEIMKRLKIKRDEHAELAVFKNELKRELMAALWQKIEGDPDNDNNQTLIEIFMKKSHYEKQMITKIGEASLQKEIMLENRKRQDAMFNKQSEEEFVESLIQKNKETNEAKFAYYMEKQRMMALHRKILDEKIRIRAEKIHNICSETVKDLVNVAIKLGEYKEEYGQEPSRREFDKIKKTFVAGEKLLDELKPIEIIIKQPEEIPELIVRNEIARQEAMDAQEFDAYMEYEYPWNLKADVDTQVIEEVTCGLNVLGNIVHLVLCGKYPLPQPPEVPNLPECNIKACINDIIDNSLIPILRKLLHEKDIAVVEIEDAVNYCLDAFKNETKIEHDEIPEEPPKSPKKKGKKDPTEKPKKGAKKGAKKKLPSIEEPSIDVKPQLVDQKSQTPLIFPCEIPDLTNKAKLGKLASEQLNAGEKLLDSDLMAMFVEYLKSFKVLKGFVLVNYPKTLEQAAFLEEAFTGLNFLENSRKFEIPEYLEDFTFKTNLLDEMAEEDSLRKSRMLPNPVKKDTPVLYDSILTTYIKLKKICVDEDSGESDLPPVLRDIYAETDPLEKFYCDMGVNYTLYYEKLDYYTVKYLGKLIIGDYTLPLKSSLELFGDTVKYIEAEITGDRALLKSAKKGENKGKPKERMKMPKAKEKSAAGDIESIKKSKKGGKDKKEKGKKGKVVIVHEDKWIQVPDISDEELEIEEEEPIIPPTAGQEGWEYTNLPLPLNLKIALATLSENLEEIYINDLKQVLFLKRVNLDCLMPFVQFVKNFMEKCINRPDSKNIYIQKFHTAFNAFDMDFRKDDEFKQEMHCRIEEFRERMLDVCDRKMMGSEDQRAKIISDSWGPTQLLEIMNVFASGVQVEIDRCVDSLNFISDYYTGVVTKMPAEETINKEQISKFKEINRDMVNILLEKIDSELDMSYFENMVEIMVKNALHIISKAQNVANGNSEKVKNRLVNPKTGKTGVKDKKKPEKGEKNILTIFEPEEIVKTNYEKIIDEWQTAIKGEISRASLRIDLLKSNAVSTIEEFLNVIKQCFHDIFKKLEEKYKNEVDEISKACDVFKCAVEHELPIQEEIIFIDDIFYINPEKILFSDPVIIPKLPEEESFEDIFKIEDLSKIVDIFLDLAPKGYMPKTSFTYLLQDLINNNPEDGSLPLVPKLWLDLDAKDVAELISKMFDDLEYVQWKEFIIQNMMITFPTELRLIEFRRQFRSMDPDKKETIRDYQFYASEFWFEDYIDDKLRLNLMKKLIFKMYQIEEGVLNYTAMLLDFSKDFNSIEGFTKALEVCLGKIVCWNKEEGEAFVEDFKTKMQDHEERVKEREIEMEENKNLVQDILEDVVTRAVAIADGVVIEDYVEESQIPEVPEKSIFEQIEEYMGKVEEQMEDFEEEQSGDTFYDLETVFYQSKCHFSNVSIDYEPTAYNKSHFLQFEPILSVITSCIPWNAKVHDVEENSLRESVEGIYRECRNEAFNNEVLSHEFLNHPKLVEVLDKTKKFKVMNPAEMVREILENKTSDS